MCLCDVSIPDKTVKLWKISERDKRPEGYNLKDDDGRIRDPSTITSLRVKGSYMTIRANTTLNVTWSKGHGFKSCLAGVFNVLSQISGYEIPD